MNLANIDCIPHEPQSMLPDLSLLKLDSSTGTGTKTKEKAPPKPCRRVLRSEATKRENDLRRCEKYESDNSDVEIDNSPNLAAALQQNIKFIDSAEDDEDDDDDESPELKKLKASLEDAIAAYKSKPSESFDRLVMAAAQYTTLEIKQRAQDTVRGVVERAFELAANIAITDKVEEFPSLNQALEAFTLKVFKEKSGTRIVLVYDRPARKWQIDIEKAELSKKIFSTLQSENLLARVSDFIAIAVKRRMREWLATAPLVA